MGQFPNLPVWETATSWYPMTMTQIISWCGPLKPNQISNDRKYKELHGTLVSWLLRSQIQIVENELSKVLLYYMENENFSFQLVLAHKHRRNAAERAIRNGKNHFLVGLSSVDDGFPNYFWCQLLDQSESTLNLLLPTIINTQTKPNKQW